MKKTIYNAIPLLLLAFSLSAAEVCLDISKEFNAPVIRNRTADEPGGFRGTANDRYVFDQVPEYLKAANGMKFKLGPASGSNAVRWRLVDKVKTIPIDAPSGLESMTFVTIGIGLNHDKDGNGKAIVKAIYADGTSSEVPMSYAGFYMQNPQAPGFSVAKADVTGKFGTAANRQFIGQKIVLDPAKKVEKLEFDMSGLKDGSGNDAEFALVAVTGTSAPNATAGLTEGSNICFDLSQFFNARTLAPANDTGGEGFRGASNEKYVSDKLAINNGKLSKNELVFSLGPLNNGNNTIKIRLNAPPCKILLTQPVNLQAISFISNGAGLNPCVPPADNGWGIVRIYYMDGTKLEEQFVYRNFYSAPPAAPAFSAGMTDITGKGGTGNNRHIYGQTIKLDPAKAVSSIEFDLTGIVDGSGKDAEFGILALTGTK